jgi:competence protein ComEA
MNAPEAWSRSLIKRRDQLVLGVLLFAGLAGMSLLIGLRDGPALPFPPLPAPVETVDLGYRVDINQANWPELTLLPGISETLARRIVAVRENQGPYQHLQSLRQVDGVGAKLCARIEPFLVGWPTSDTPATSRD